MKYQTYSAFQKNQAISQDVNSVSPVVKVLLTIECTNQDTLNHVLAELLKNPEAMAKLFNDLAPLDSFEVEDEPSYKKK